jgi:hypothetical protein
MDSHFLPTSIGLCEPKALRVIAARTGDVFTRTRDERFQTISQLCSKLRLAASVEGHGGGSGERCRIDRVRFSFFTSP